MSKLSFLGFNLNCPSKMLNEIMNINNIYIFAQQSPQINLFSKMSKISNSNSVDLWQNYSNSIVANECLLPFLINL